MEPNPGAKPKEAKPAQNRNSVITPRVVFVAACSILAGSLNVTFMPRAVQELLNHYAPGAKLDQIQAAWMTPAYALLGVLLGAWLGSILNSLFRRIARTWDGLQTGDKVDVFFGIFVGIITALPFLVFFQTLGQIITPLLTFSLVVGFSAMSIYILKSIGEVLPWHKPGVGGVAARRSGVKVLDTNVLIDGRLYDIVRTGFLEGEMYVSQFVLNELQSIADSSDAMRRQRGRRGLEVLRHLQSEFKVTVGVHDRLAPDEKEPVDSRLVRIAKGVGGDLVSNDYNLNKVARIQDVQVLNINDLALSLRPTVLPGEAMELHLIREGSQHGQAVGYLDDGTMVVVEGGRAHIGETTEVVVTQVIQTERGKMIFANLDGLDASGGHMRRGRGGR